MLRCVRADVARKKDFKVRFILTGRFRSAVLFPIARALFNSRSRSRMENEGIPCGRKCLEMKTEIDERWSGQDRDNRKYYCGASVVLLVKTDCGGVVGE